jgi:hypothetical protein
MKKFTGRRFMTGDSVKAEQPELRSPGLVGRKTRRPAIAILAQRFLRAFLQMHLPEGSTARKGLIVASSRLENIAPVLESLATLYPGVNFHILADDRDGRKLQKMWPDLHIEVYRLALPREEKFHLLSALQEEQYDLAVVLLGGEAGYDFLKMLALFSGAKVVQARTEFGASFPIIIGRLRTILRYLIWRSKQEPLLAIYTRSKFSSVRSALGYGIVLYRVIPLLRSARKMKDRKNPFMVEKRERAS